MRKEVLFAVVTLFLLVLSSLVFAASNPAAVYCEDMGYVFSTVKDQDGAEHGVCTVDGVVCDAFDFYDGRCQPQESFCVKNGYGIGTEHFNADLQSPEVAVCLDTDVSPLTGAVTAVEEGAGWITRLIRWLAQWTLTGHATLEMKEDPGWVYTDEGWRIIQLTDVYTPSIDDDKCGTKDPEPDSAPRLEGTLDSGVQDGPDSDAPVTAPGEFDWRSYGGQNFITPIKNQGSCGSCWAFASVAVVEAKQNIQEDNPDLDPDISEEYLNSDCHSFLGYQTCCGGYKTAALDFFRTSGVPDELCFPYAESCSCSSSCSVTCTYNTGSSCSDWTCSDRCADYSSRLWKISGWSEVQDPTEAAAQQLLVDYGPITVSVAGPNTGGSHGGYWDGDIFRCTDDTITNHAVVIVGYSNSGGYWIIKNSWGSTWNGDGYYKLGYDECGISWFTYIGSVNTDFPYLTLYSPGDSSVTSDDPVMFNYSVDLNVAATATCQLIIDGEVNMTNSSVPDSVLSSFSVSLDDGDYSWNISCWENGNGAIDYSSTRSLHVDKSPPQITIVSPQPITYASGSIPLEFIATDISGVHSCWFTNTTGDNQSLPSCQNTSLSVGTEGNHTVVVYANDSVGYTASLGQNFTVDLYPPEVVLAQPTPPDAYTTDNTSVTVAVNVTDAVSEISGCVMEWSEGLVTYNYTMQNSCSGGEGTCLITHSFNGSGIFTYKVFVSDSAGHVGVSATRMLNITNTPPNITSHYPAVEDVSIAEPENQTFNITYEDVNNDYVSVAWYLDGVLVSGSTGFFFAGNYSCAGVYNVTVVLSDTKDISRFSWNLSVGNTNRVPQTGEVLVASSDSLNRSNGTLSGSFSYSDADDEPIAGNATLWFNSSVPATAFENQTEVPSSVIRRGEVWTFSVRVYDGIDWSGWTNSSSVTVVNVPPMLDDIPDIEVDETGWVNVTASATDEDSLTYGVNDSRFSQDRGLFYWKTGLDDAGAYSILINVTDGEDHDEQVIQVQVMDAPDFDDDGDPDFNDTDDDNDGLPDVSDSVTGNATDIDATFTIPKLFINGSDNLSVLYTDVYPVNITDAGNNTLIEFDWNFSEPLVVNMTITFNVSNSTMRVRSLGLASQGVTKTVYINKSDTGHNYVCISDDEVTSALPEDCSGYTKVYCGSSGQCIDLGDRFRVSGLSHSILRTLYVAPSSSSSGGGGGGGGGGTSDTRSSVTIVPGAEGFAATLDKDTDATLIVDGIAYGLRIGSIGIADVLFTIDGHYYTISLLSRDLDIDVDKDAVRDVSVHLVDIDGDSAVMTFRVYIPPVRPPLLPANYSRRGREVADVVDAQAPEDAEASVQETVPPVVESPVESSMPFSGVSRAVMFTGLFMLMLVLIIAALFVVLFMKHRRASQAALKRSGGLDDAGSVHEDIEKIRKKIGKV